ncbi:MAG TPA: Wzz/FepE/Etk N-terminal domain-containing protein [Phenylobacterium sp.]
MNLFQFLRILWAYRLIVVTCAVVSFVLAVSFVQIAPPRYEAQARVMLDVVKPDPVTGQVLSTAFLRAYTKTQIELVKDMQVAGRVVDDLDWANNPSIQAWYRTRDRHDDLDFKHWAAKQIVDGTDARLIEGSNILEITFSSASPVRAKVVANGLRKAYLDMTLQSRQESARRNAEWYEAQAEKSRALLLRAEEAKSDFERASGIILQDNKVDIDTARLAALAGQGSAPILSPTNNGSSALAMQLAQVDDQISQAAKTLGPNHPMLVEMKRRRGVLAKQVEQERNESNAAASAALGAARASSSVLEAQKAKVMAQREKVEKLHLMQDEADLRRGQYNNAIARAAQLRQEAEVAVSGVTPLGAAIMPQSAEFPNKPLIVGASIPFGLGLGLFLAVMLEFVRRRVRGPDDMTAMTGAPVLAVIHTGGVRKKWYRQLIPNVPVSVRWRPRSANP